MSNEQSAYLDIKLKHLKGKKLFPFSLYIYNANLKKYTPFLISNTPLVQAKLIMLETTLKTGGRIAVARKDQEKFFQFSGLNEEQIQADTTPDVFSQTPEQSQADSGLPPPSQDESFHFKEELAEAIKTDNYKKIIDQVRKEIDLFKPTISHTVSFARYLVNNQMTEDIYNNRIVAVSYCFAKLMNMKTEDVLGDLICAAFYHNVGLTQLNGNWAHHGYLKLSGEERKKYSKHPKISYHVLKKVDLDLTDRCYKIIVEHHERIDGSGYPQGKIGEQIEPLALVLGVISHIFEYSTGRITGENVQLPIIIKNLKNKTYTAGLESGFGDTIIETLSQLVDMEDAQKKAKPAEASPPSSPQGQNVK